MGDKASVIVLITHPDIDPVIISEKIGIEPNLTQKAGDQVITPRGNKINSRYAISRWQYKKQLGPDSSWYDELASIVAKISNNKGFFRAISADGGKTIIYFSATDYPNAALEVNPSMLSVMSQCDIFFGFDIFTSELR